MQKRGKIPCLALLATEANNLLWNFFRKIHIISQKSTKYSNIKVIHNDSGNTVLILQTIPIIWTKDDKIFESQNQVSLNWSINI